jgi:ATP-binding cassette, subfamily B, bacterial
MRGRLRRLWPFVRTEASPLGAVLALSLLATATSLGSPLLSRRLVDDVMVPGRWERLPALVAAMVGLGLAGMLLGGASSWVYTRASSRIVVAMRGALFRHLERAELSFFRRTRLGDIVARVGNDVADLQGVMVDAPLTLATSLLRLAGASAVLIALSPRLFLLGNVLVPLGALGLWVSRRTLTSLSRRLREENAAVGARLIDTFAGIRLVRSSGAEEQEARRFEAESASLLASVMRFQAISSLARGVPSALLAGSAAIALLAGGAMVRDGQISAGTLVAFTAFQVQVVVPIQSLLGLFVALRRAKASLDRVFELFDVPVEDVTLGATAPPLRGEIAFRGVRYAYEPGRPVLDGVSFTIPAGGTTALVGESGAGKSTIVDLLLRFQEPEGGEILLDGLPLSRIARASLRRAFALVSTEPHLFHGTLAENIAYGEEGATRAAVERAAAQADLGALVSALPAGLDTFVGERGAQLSAGQRQRVALARAFLRAPDVLVLDEATSSLDVLAEDRVRRSIRELMAGRTTVVVTHRLRSVREADRIVILEHGRVTHEGTHVELARSGGPYRAFLRAGDAGRAGRAGAL